MNVLMSLPWLIPTIVDNGGCELACASCQATKTGDDVYWG